MIRKQLSGILLCLLIFMVGCGQKNTTTAIKERLVEVVTVENKELTEELYYFGFIQPSILKSYSMKTGGHIEEIFVDAGDQVALGDILLTLDDFEYDISAQVSSDQVSLARLELDKAIENLTLKKDVYEDSLILFESGALSKASLDQAKLGYDIADKEVQQGRKSLNQALGNLAVKNATLKDTALVSDMDGYIVEVLNKPGELATAGYSLIVARSQDSIVEVGMTASDVQRIAVGDVAKVLVGEISYDGLVEKINLMANEGSRTYTVRIRLSEGEFIIGQPCKVFIPLKVVEGIWLEILNVHNDGVDYVYIVEDGRATRRDIGLHEINGHRVRVTGLSSGQRVIISGYGALSEGYRVKVVGDENE